MHAARPIRCNIPPAAFTTVRCTACSFALSGRERGKWEQGTSAQACGNTPKWRYRYVSSALRTAPTSIFSISSCGKAAQRNCPLPRWCTLRLRPVPRARAGPLRDALRRAHFHRRVCPRAAPVAPTGAICAYVKPIGCRAIRRTVDRPPWLASLQLLPRSAQHSTALAHLVVFERIEQVRRLEHVALTGGAACAAQRICCGPRVRPEGRAESYRAIAIARGATRRGAAWHRRAGAASAANSWARAAERRRLHMTEHPRTSSTRSTDSCKAKAKAKAKARRAVAASVSMETDRFGHVALELAGGFARAVAARDRR